MRAEITPVMVKSLRMRTGVGVAKCKEALVEARGDEEDAVRILREWGVASAVKKGGRETAEGIVAFAENSSSIFLVEVDTETDFVVQNARFREFVDHLCEGAMRSPPSSLEGFLQQEYRGDMRVDEARAQIVQVLGENVWIRRILTLPKVEGQSFGIYSHNGGKIVSVVALKGVDGQTIARDLAMHVASESPEYLHARDLPAAVRSREESIAMSQIGDRPPEIRDKIVRGKLAAYCEQCCFLQQRFIKDPSLTVAQYVAEEGRKMGRVIEVMAFVRWRVGGS